MSRFDDVAYSRRRFLAGAGVLAGAIVAGYGVEVWGRPAQARTPVAPAREARDRILVVVELAGGNDGLSTVVPYTDPSYPRLRPTLAVADPIDLDGVVGLHPNLARLADRYRAGQVAIVEGVGYPDQDLSHFASLANWWTAQPGRPATTGWLGRYLDATVGYDDPLAGVVVGGGRSPALTGAASFATSIAEATGLEPRMPSWVTDPDDVLASWARLGDHEPASRSLEDRVRQAIALTDRARSDLRRILTATPGDDTTADARVYEGAAPVSETFALAARLVTAPTPPRVVYISNLGDYDTHQGQAQRHPALLADLDAGVDHLLGAAEAAGIAERVLVMTVSEFGRRVPENGSGTDHGGAAPHFLVGARVRGGRYGRAAALDDLDARGNLPFGVDFRSLYATALEGWLGVDAEPILGDGFPPEPVFAHGAAEGRR